MGGSPLLAAYVAGLVLGNSRAAAQEVLEEAHSSSAKMAELLLFCVWAWHSLPKMLLRRLDGLSCWC